MIKEKRWGVPKRRELDAKAQLQFSNNLKKYKLLLKDNADR